MPSRKSILGLVAAAALGAAATLLVNQSRSREIDARLNALESGARPTASRKVYTAQELGEMHQAKFAAEPRDSAWADAAEREYRSVIEAQMLSASRFVSIECRSRFCRLEVVHESINSSNEFLMRLFSMPSSSDAGPSLVRAAGGFHAAPPKATPDGKLDYVVYIARPGVSAVLDWEDAGPPSP